ncbi:hypothetical protein FQA39_LY13897 [Lamprigera yunnana]|nr:hypothetical protein FQA39_LY13897 [Lamprigera yunnana]
MSDTDDTDNLLLIPPDSFAIASDTEEPYYTVVDSLITKVSNLEHRVNSLSSSPCKSSLNSSLNCTCLKPNNFMSEVRKYNSLEDLPREIYKGNIYTSPSKSKHIQIHSLPTTPNVQFSVQNGQNEGQKRQNQMLGDIDTFISNVKTIQKFQSARNLSSQFNNYILADQLKDDLSQRFNLKDVNEMLNKVESQQREMESKIKEKEEEIDLKSEVQRMRSEGEDECEIVFKEQPVTKNYKEWRLSDKDSILINDEDLANVLFNEAVEKSPFKLLTATGILAPQDLSDISARNTESSGETRSLSSSHSTLTTAYQTKSNDSNKIHNNALNVLNMHKKLMTHDRCDLKDEEKTRCKPNVQCERNSSADLRWSNYEASSKNALALLSLSELWNHQNDLQQIDRSKFLQKLQEENLRRQHCEQLIQKLQAKKLELTERLAIAIEVDKAKDEAITQIHKSWEEAASNIDDLFKKNSNLEQIVLDLRNKLSQESSEANQKITFYEKESSKALNLAHSSQERLGVLEKENSELNSQLESLKSLFGNLQENYNLEREKLSTMFSEKDNELKENKYILADARIEITQSKRAVEICQTELMSMRATQKELEQQLNQELEHIKEIENEKRKVLMDIESHKKIQKSLQDEVSKQKENMEQQKNELKSFYQDQVEIIIGEKLREFQSQLEKTETNFQKEIHNREISIAKTAATHLQQITEKHALEVHLLEEKHREEVKLYNIQLARCQQQIENLHSKFQHQQDRKSQIAKQLHRVMEAQWLEALKILDSKTPIIPQDQGRGTIDQLNTLKNRSFTNVEEILFKDDPKQKASGDNKKVSSPDTLSSPVDDFSNKNMCETPLTSRPHKTRQQSDQEIHKFVEMFLTKPHKNPNDEKKGDKKKPHSPEHFNSCPINGECQSHYDKGNCGDGFKTSSKSVYRDRLGKRPWK